ncbi:MAG: YegS/Rv2252/BmrU family lipid kinase [Bacteroidota bacterium]|nr:YegS/Rv2252/BmrU family lipid kinase [Bacteroidota bacterium]
MAKENYAIICNPKSGKGISLKVLPQFEAYLKSRYITYEVFTGELPGTLSGFTCLVIMGGDGTLNYTINHFKTISIPIALLRCGTGNDYTNLFVGSASMQKQFEIACGNHMEAVDAGLCNGKLFINGVGIGFDGWVVKKNLGKRFFSGQLAYLSTILSLLLFYKESEVTLEIDGITSMHNIFMLSIANGRTYGGGFKVAPMALPGDGLLDFVGIRKISLWNRCRYLPVIEKGKHLHLPFVMYHQAKNIKVSCKHKLQAQLEGEWMESEHFDIEILPGAYRIKTEHGYVSLSEVENYL